jgi:hypothetical protein
LNVKKIDTQETKLFLKHFNQITMMMGIKLHIKKII